MGQALQDGDRGDVHGVAGEGFEGANAAFAEDDFEVAAGHDVFGRKQHFFNGGGDAALQQDGLVDAAQILQQVEVLHVARADLEDVHVLEHERNLRRIHHFADDDEAVFIGGGAHDLQALFAHALEAIGRAAGLEGTAPEHLATGVRDDGRGALNLILVFDAARSAHGDDFVAADSDFAHRNDGALGAEGLSRQLVGRHDEVALLDAGHHFKVGGFEPIGRADAG